MECLVVRHRGARRMTLRVDGAGARLTVPPGTPERAIRAMLERNAAWMARHRPAPVPAPADGMALALLDERVALRIAGGRRGAARLAGGELLLPLAAGADPAVALERWYRSHARAVLGAMADEEAAALGRAHAGVSVRDPRSRWGSCSAAGRLSFSWRLLLAPAWVARHVVVHEACHLVHLDHSPAFWELVRSRDARTDRARAWLRAHGDALRRGPAWEGPAGPPPAP